MDAVQDFFTESEYWALFRWPLTVDGFVAEFVEAFSKPKFKQEIIAKLFCTLILFHIHLGLKFKYKY